MGRRAKIKVAEHQLSAARSPLAAPTSPGVAVTGRAGATSGPFSQFRAATRCRSLGADGDASRTAAPRRHAMPAGGLAEGAADVAAAVLRRRKRIGRC